MLTVWRFVFGWTVSVVLLSLDVAIGVELQIEVGEPVPATLTEARAIMQSKNLNPQQKITAQTSTDLRTFLGTRKLLPKGRIAAVDEWLKSNVSPLAVQRDQFRAQSTQPTVAVENSARIALRNAMVGRTPDEQALASLANEFANAVSEMRSEQISPRQRARNFDEFFRVNREALEELRELGRKIALQHSVNTPPPIAIGLEGRTPEEVAIVRSLQEIATRRAAIEKLKPRERLRAMDRDMELFRSHMNSLRELRNNAIQPNR